MKKESPTLQNVVIGERVRVYITTKGAIAYSKTKHTTEATVIGVSRYPNIYPDNYEVLLGWRQDDVNRVKASDRFGYRPVAIVQCTNGRLLNFNGEYYQPHPQGGTRYWFVPDINTYFSALWVNSGTPRSIEASYSYVINKGKCGPFKFINAKDIQPGDTVAFNGGDDFCYTTVEDIDEFEVSDTPMISLKGSIYVQDGAKVYSEGLAIPPDRKVILINRM